MANNRNRTQQPVEKASDLGEEKPVFNFSDSAWGESKRQARIISEMEIAANANDLEAMDRLLAETVAYMAKVTVSIPRSWIARSAPEGLDWSKPASFEYVRSDRFATLRWAMIQAQQVINISGN